MFPIFARAPCNESTMATAATACRQRCSWRRRLRTPPPPAADATPIATKMRVVRTADAQLAFPDECFAVLGDLSMDSVVKRRDGLPRLAAALGGALNGEPLRVCYLGGSVTEQRTGYRPRVTRWLESQGKHANVKVEEVPAFCGSNANARASNAC